MKMYGSRNNTMLNNMPETLLDRSDIVYILILQ